MAKLETVRVTLFDGSYDDTMMTVPAAVEWLQELLAQIPEEFRDASVFQVEKEGGCYDESDTLIFQVYYDRPETEEEAAAREAKVRAQKEEWARHREEEERRTLAALKAKYGL